MDFRKEVCKKFFSSLCLYLTYYLIKDPINTVPFFFFFFLFLYLKEDNFNTEWVKANGLSSLVFVPLF